MVGSTEKHATVKTYLVFAAILSVITLCEWAIFKIESVRVQPLIIVPSLLILSLAKFVMVVGWYMHLRYDHGWLWKIFAFSGMLATGTFLVVMLCLPHAS